MSLYDIERESMASSAWFIKAYQSDRWIDKTFCKTGPDSALDNPRVHITGQVLTRSKLTATTKNVITYEVFLILSEVFSGRLREVVVARDEEATNRTRETSSCAVLPAKMIAERGFIWLPAIKP